MIVLHHYSNHYCYLSIYSVMFWVFPWPWLFTWFYHSSSHSVLMVKWTRVYFKLASCRVLEAAKLNFVEHHRIFLVNTKSWGTFLEFFFDSDPSSWHLTLPLYAKTYRSCGWSVFYKKAVLIIFAKFTRHMFRAFSLQLYLKRNSDTVYLWFCNFFFYQNVSLRLMSKIPRSS